MKPGSGERREKGVGELLGEMGRERRALRGKRTAIALLRISSFLCLVPAFASLIGYIPYTPGPFAILIITSVIGFVISVLEDRHP